MDVQSIWNAISNDTVQPLNNMNPILLRTDFPLSEFLHTKESSTYAIITYDTDDEDLQDDAHYP